MDEAQDTVQNTGDEYLLQKVQKGDYEALELLYNQYSRAAFGLAYRMLTDAGAAEDIVQEVFIKVWRAPDSYDSKRGRFVTWLLSVVHNQCIDQLRKKRHPAASLDQEETQERLNYLAEDTLGLEEEVWLKMRREVVRQALHLLPEQQRKMIELAFFGGYTHQEIAQQTGQPLGTVKSRIRQGLLKLKDYLKNAELGSSLG